MAMITASQFTEELTQGVQALVEKETTMTTATIQPEATETKRKSLYGLNMSFKAILHRLEDIALEDEQDPEEIEMLEELLQIDAEQFLEVAERYGFKIEELEARAKYLKEKAANWTRLAKAKEVLSGRLKARLLDAMNKRGERKVETESHVISLRKSEGVVITDKDSIPDAWMKTEIVSKPDKAGMKKALKVGQEIPGVTLEQRQNVQIK